MIYIYIYIYIFNKFLPWASDSSHPARIEEGETAKLGSVQPSVQPTLASWPPFCPVQSALAALSEPIWPPRCPSELQNGLRSSNLVFQAALQVQLGASWVDFWCSYNPQNRALASTRAQFSWFRHFCSPSALGLLFRSSAVGLGRLLDSTWRLLGVSWGALGRSSAGLGRSWRALGRFGGALGVPTSLLKRHFCRTM